ncbi:hypothetical protein M434DRAFT_30882 [Hypoxylon sp. CO27-5]|nr:hypothetical protein M434DRAFT_30882 [Hypoxylon sp. CO27-5]
MNATTFFTYGAQRWLAGWLDITAISVVMVTDLLIIFGGGIIQLVVQHLGELEDCVTSTQHLHHHCTQLPKENS